MFHKSVSDIVEWLRSVRTGATVVRMIQRYLKGRGRVKMQSLVSKTSEYQLVAKFHDRLGWDNFVEGRLCSIWLQHREADIARHRLRSTAESWAKGLIHRLLELTHRQWIYRNTEVHFVAEGGLTLRQHEELMDQVEDYATVDPDDLLPENRALLEIDFDALGKGSTQDKQFWVAEMDSAISAAEHIKQGTRQALRTRYELKTAYDTRPTTVTSTKDSEGSIRWRRRRKRRKEKGT